MNVPANSNDVCLTVIIRDHGKPFDPSTVVTPDLDADIDNRAVGGLGVFLMKQLMDEVHFEPLGEAGNVLTMVKRRKKGNIESRLDIAGCHVEADHPVGGGVDAKGVPGSPA